MILVIDNYDSFTYNLVQYLGQCGATSRVFRNDKISIPEIVELKPKGIMLSPGPCRPTDSGICLDILKVALDPEGHLRGIPLFGVCLGHQAIGIVGGGKVSKSKRVMHGKTSPIKHDGKGLFEGLPNPMTVARYHSLSIEQNSVPTDFYVTSTAEDDGEIMGVRHKELPIEGVQFHPESIVTESGIKIIENFVRMTKS